MLKAFVEVVERESGQLFRIRNVKPPWIETTHLLLLPACFHWATVFEAATVANRVGNKK